MSPRRLSTRFARRRASRRKLRILYCDDNADFRNKFAHRHAAHFEIELLDDIADVYDRVTQRAARDLPDLLLLDLYHPKLADEDDPGAAARRERAEQELAALRDLIVSVRDYVDAAWTPVAIDVLEELRKRYPAHTLPIMIYTQRGLLLLNDEEMRRIELSDADWLLKDPGRISAATEAIWVRQFVARMNESRAAPRDLKLAVMSAVASAVAGATLGTIGTLLFG